MPFETTIDDSPWNESFSPLPPNHPTMILPRLRAALAATQRMPATIYVNNPKAIAPVEDLLAEVHGTRGTRTSVLHSDGPDPFTIHWGS